MGAQGHLTRCSNGLSPGIKYTRSKNVFTVTSIALIVVRLCAELLQLPAQSLIGSPGTLHGTNSHGINGGFLRCEGFQRMQETKSHTATHCNTLQHTATHCSTLQRTATHCNALQHTAMHCSTLQRTATHCKALQHTATHCSTRAVS